ncbi:MAG: glycoside hydrolase family 16 protein [Melioribacteraceae bacterium]|jgi:beta-glucanase (GH16 family)|nr:glycoside hydrolase family 16 protein [Melioribacteraceae bacterium]
MKYIKISLLTLLFSSLSCSAQSTENEPKKNDGEIPGWTLIWSDEFNKDGLPDANKWGYDVGDHGWGNQELQYYSAYRSENARVEKGKLLIEARRDFYNGKEYTSARLVTKGKGDWIYGRLEIRAKLPAGRGTWPAIWMLPSVWSLGNKGWPDNGEIDIMEHVGYNQNVVHASIHCNKYVHTNGTQKTATINISDATSNFHNYIVEWDENQIKAYVDDKLYFTFVNEGKGWEYWPFYKSFHLILNIAVGGTWGGAKGVDISTFPQRMEVEYIRVYKKN